MTRTFEPLKELASCGVPIFIVPGNHERSRIPVSLFDLHPGIHIFHRPSTRTLKLSGRTVAISGIPFHRGDANQWFPQALAATEWMYHEADLRILCMHQAVEGAQVGPGNFTFRDHPEVIRASLLPGHFDAIVSGHIHRHQVLERDLRGTPLPVPVYYPGSIERTSFAERLEDKGFIRLTLRRRPTYEFIRLPARPMIDVHLRASELDEGNPEAVLRGALSTMDPNGIVRLHIQGSPSRRAQRMLSAERLRAVAPSTMTVTVARAFWRQAVEIAGGDSQQEQVAVQLRSLRRGPEA